MENVADLMVYSGKFYATIEGTGFMWHGSWVEGYGIAQTLPIFRINGMVWEQLLHVGSNLPLEGRDFGSFLGYKGLVWSGYNPKVRISGK